MCNLNPDSQKFLLFSYFGNGTPGINDFIGRAYLDLCRTLKGLKNIDDGIKKNWKENIAKIINSAIYELNSKVFLNQDEFNDWHKNICNEIAKITESFFTEPKFTDGHAQKWFNMALKYEMLFDKKFKPYIKAFMHVPVDSFIMEAASKKGIEIKRDNKKCKTKEYGEYSEYSSLVWSQWDRTTYDKFQKELREKIKPQHPIDWEADEWIEFAKKS